MASRHGGGTEMLDILTKEEKEDLLNKKMEEIRRKNEALQRRHAEIQADRRAAEQSGQAVVLNPKSPSTEPMEPRLDHATRPRAERKPSDTKPRPAQPRDNKPDSRETQPKAEPNRGQRPRRLHSNEEEHYGRKRSNDEEAPPGEHVNMKGVVNAETRPRAAGRGKRLTQMSQQKLKAQDYEKSKRNSQTESEPGGPPPDPGYSFLADPSRERVVEQPASDAPRRHPRNYGGTSFDNVKSRIQDDKERQQGRFRGAPHTELEMSVQMTGRERRAYSQWKTEREQIDQQRMQRQRNKEGDWRRAWDVDKIEPTPPTPPMSKRMEPGRRPGNVS